MPNTANDNPPTPPRPTTPAICLLLIVPCGLISPALGGTMIAVSIATTCVFISRYFKYWNDSYAKAPKPSNSQFYTVDENGKILYNSQTTHCTGSGIELTGGPGVEQDITTTDVIADTEIDTAPVDYTTDDTSSVSDLYFDPSNAWYDDNIFSSHHD